jgi:hypothetical protein
MAKVHYLDFGHMGLVSGFSSAAHQLKRPQTAKVQNPDCGQKGLAVQEFDPYRLYRPLRSTDVNEGS